MKRTGLLSVITDIGIKKGNVVIHPNDGYDLGLMNREYPVKMFINEGIEVLSKESNAAVAGSIFLENDCRLGAIEMSSKQWTEMGQPDKVMLIHDKGKLLMLGNDFSVES